MTSLETEHNGNDHDLLIRVHENVRNLIGEVKTMRDDTQRRLGEVENSKLDKRDFQEYKLQDEKSQHEFKQYVEHTLMERSKEAEKRFTEIVLTQHNQDIKISKLEKIAYIAIGAFGLLQIILNVVKQ